MCIFLMMSKAQGTIIKKTQPKKKWHHKRGAPIIKKTPAKKKLEAKWATHRLTVSPYYKNFGTLVERCAELGSIIGAVPGCRGPSLGGMVVDTARTSSDFDGLTPPSMTEY